MKSLHNFIAAWARPFGLQPGRGAFLPVVLGLVCLGLASAARAQVVPAADEGGLRLSAGGTASAYELGYGEVKIMGVSAFVDADASRHFGIEAEGRWLFYHWKADGPGVDEHTTTYMIGPRYSRYYGRFQPYVKGLVGIGQFNYSYNYAKETDLVAAPGGGVDFRLTRRIRWRVLDFEYQIWPQFHYGQMSSYGLSTGIRVKIN
jgi:hypothetical protein